MNTVMKSIIKIWNKIRFWAVGPHNVVILSLQRAVCILFYNLFCLHNWLALPKAMRLGYARGTFTMEDLQRDSNRFLPSSKYGFRWSCNTLVRSAGQGLVSFHRQYLQTQEAESDPFQYPELTQNRACHAISRCCYLPWSEQVPITVQHVPYSWSLSILWARCWPSFDT